MKRNWFLIILLLGFADICYPMQVGKPQSEDLLGKELILKSEIQDEQSCLTLDFSFLKLAYECNKTLKSSDPDCFNPVFIKNPRKAFQKLNELSGEPLTVSCETSPAIHCTFFDRKSDTLLVLGTGFPVQRERMLPFVKIFPTYDLLLFDYRGIGSDHSIDVSYLLPWKWMGLLSWEIRGIDFNVSGIGTLEEDDVIAAIDACKQQKNYRNVFGLGLCFSSYVFARATAKRPNLFDKLIFDGSWPSLERVVKSIIKDPSLLCTVETPHSPLPCLTDQEITQACGFKLTEWLAWVDLHTLPLSYYLSKLTCPILFFQSLNDCYCNAEEFATLWNAVKTPKFAIFTNNLHGRNHVWQAEAYKEIAHAFLENQPNLFMENLLLQR